MEVHSARIVYVLVVLLSLSKAWSQEACDGSKSFYAVKDVAKIIDEGCGKPVHEQMGKKRLEEIIKSESNKNIKNVGSITELTSRTATSVTYKLSPERVLNPGEALYFSIPTDLQKSSVNFIVLGHRQNPQTEKGFNTQSKWDDTPGITSVQVHASNFSSEKAWRYWMGQASGNKGGKFAEVSYAPEMENLYEWHKYGTSSVVGDEFSGEPVKVDAARLVSVGKDPVSISEFTLKIDPPQPDLTLSQIFTNGTSFNKAIGQPAKFGGGQNYDGIFPQALALGGGGNPSLPKGWKMLDSRTLQIDLPEGKKLTSVEVAGGDSHPDKITNKDGGSGTPGWAKLSIGVGLTPQNAEWFIRRENVPPEGLLLGSPRECDRQVSAGEKIFVRGDDDILYVMAVRVGLKN